MCLPDMQELIRSMLEVEVDQRYTALQVLEHPWVTVSTASSELIELFFLFNMHYVLSWIFCLHLIQDEGLCENDHQLSVAGKIKKHFNTSPKVNDTTAGVSVISVSHMQQKFIQSSASMSLNSFSIFRQILAFFK